MKTTMPVLKFHLLFMLFVFIGFIEFDMSFASPNDLIRDDYIDNVNGSTNDVAYGGSLKNEFYPILPVINSMPFDPEHNWVEVYDTNVEVIGDPSNVPVSPLAPTPTNSVFRAVEVEAYWDSNGNGLVDDYDANGDGVVDGNDRIYDATFPLETRAQPADSQGRTYTSVPGVNYACHTGLNRCANLIVVMLIESTGGTTPPNANAYLAMHYHYEVASNTFWLLDVRGGDYWLDVGKTMIWPGQIPAGYSNPTLNIQLPSPGASNGFVSGTLAVNLVFIETFSYFDITGNPAVGQITYNSTVGAEFAVSLRPN